MESQTELNTKPNSEWWKELEDGADSNDKRDTSKVFEEDSDFADEEASFI